MREASPYRVLAGRVNALRVVRAPDDPELVAAERALAAAQARRHIDRAIEIDEAAARRYITECLTGNQPATTGVYTLTAGGAP